MGSLRINDAPTLADLATRLARRKSRDAITGQIIVQAYNRLGEIAGCNGIQSLLPGVDEIYSDELRQLGLKEEKISPRIREVREVSISGHSSKDLGLEDWQEFEFALTTQDQTIRQAKELLKTLDLKSLNIDNVPTLRGIVEDPFDLFEDPVEPVVKRLGLSSDEKEKLELYLHKREEIIRANCCSVTKRNRIVLSGDMHQIGQIPDWAPVTMVINGLTDPEEVRDELESIYDSVVCGEIDFIRIESNLKGNEILINAYSRMFLQ